MPHGHHRRERRRGVRHHARAAGRVRGREPAEGRAAPSTDGIFKEEIVPVEVPAEEGRAAVRGQRRAPARRHDHGETLAQAAHRRSARTAAPSPPATPRHQRRRVGARRDVADARPNERGLEPLGTIESYASVGVEPRDHGHGPVPASGKALEKAGLRVEEIDLWELNEAFAAQSLGVRSELGIPRNA